MAPPRSNKRVSSYDDEGDDFVVSDNDTSDRPAKKARTSTASSKRPFKDTQGDPYWELSKARRVTLSEFKGKTLVSVREYYEKDGKDLPGKKGISMTLDQFCTLVDLLPDIEKELKDRGQKIPRPRYNKGTPGDANGNTEDDAMEEAAPTLKKENIEATSDEDDED